MRWNLTPIGHEAAVDFVKLGRGGGLASLILLQPRGEQRLGLTLAHWHRGEWSNGDFVREFASWEEAYAAALVDLHASAGGPWVDKATLDR